MNNKYFSLVYFVTRAFFLGIIYSQIINISGTDAIISSLLGILIGSFLIYIMKKLNINNTSNKYFLLLIYINFIIISIVILEVFINSFFLISTPKIIIIIPTIVLCIYSSFKSIKQLNNTGLILFFICFSLSILTILSLYLYFDINNIFPLFTSKTINIIKSSFIFATLSSIPNILVLNTKITTKEHIKYYIYTTLFNTLICLIVICCLTLNVAKIYSFPEYMILKRIKLLEFIENIENIIASIWYIDIFFVITLSLKNIYLILKNKIYFLILILLIVLFTIYIILSNYSIVLYIYNYSYYITSFIFMLIIISSLIKHKKN